jgi:hypothetical protein
MAGGEASVLLLTQEERIPELPTHLQQYWPRFCSQCGYTLLSRNKQKRLLCQELCQVISNSGHNKMVMSIIAILQRKLGVWS